MDAFIANYRLSKTRQHPNQAMITIEGCTTKEAAAKYVGKKVAYHTGKKDITGTISHVHGNSGRVRATFETGLPGQAIAAKVKIL